MIRIYTSNKQDDSFYAIMGRYFASLDIAKELERQLYNKANSVWYIFADDYGSLAGFAALFDNGNHYFLDNLYVKPRFRGIGIAKGIVHKIVSDYTDKPIKCIANNPYALKIFGSLGFEEVVQNGKYKKLRKY